MKRDGARSGLDYDNSFRPSVRPEDEAKATPCVVVAAAWDRGSACLGVTSSRCCQLDLRGTTHSPVDYWEAGSCIGRSTSTVMGRRLGLDS